MAFMNGNDSISFVNQMDNFSQNSSSGLGSSTNDSKDVDGSFSDKKTVFSSEHESSFHKTNIEIKDNNGYQIAPIGTQDLKTVSAMTSISKRNDMETEFMKNSGFSSKSG